MVPIAPPDSSGLCSRAMGNPSSCTTLEEAEIPSPTSHSPSVRGENPPWFFWGWVGAFFYRKNFNCLVDFGKEMLSKQRTGGPT